MARAESASHDGVVEAGFEAANEADDRVPRRRSPRLDSLTSMRTVAALAVVLVHVGSQFANAPSLTTAAGYGYVGVSFFYMISGFVLTYSCADQPAGRFWWSRFSRIYPLQCLMAVFAFTVIAAQERVPGPFGHVLDLLLLQAWSPRSSIYFGGNGVSWSLSVEFFFYLIFPFVIGPIRRLRGRGLAVTAAAVMLVMAGAPIVATLAGMPSSLSYWLFFIFPPYRFGEFLIGMLLARAVMLGLRVRWPGLACLGSVAGTAAVVWALTAFTVRTGTPVQRPFVALFALPFFALAILAAATRDTRGHWWLASRPLVRLGEWSYALYLVHKPTFLFTSRWGWWNNSGGLAALLDFMGFLALAIAVAAVLHHLVERPLQRRLRRVLDASRQPASTGRGV